MLEETVMADCSNWKGVGLGRVVRLVRDIYIAGEWGSECDIAGLLDL